MKLIEGRIAYVIDIHESEEKVMPVVSIYPWAWHYN